MTRKTRSDCTVGVFEKKQGLPPGTLRNENGIGGEITVDLGEGKESFSVFIIDVDYTSYNAQKQLNEKINILTDTQLLKQTEVLDDGKVAYTLTPKAWNIVQNIQSKTNIPPQAFIAMWFDSSMTNARNVISQAISDCGYLPVVIDEKEYNSFIVPEILYEIENSSFIVADFTGDRGGVYYEAGFAKGLRKEVIMTCQDGKFDPHFDTKQINHIIWKTEDELYERLKKRIKATIGSRANDTARVYYGRQEREMFPDVCATCGKYDGSFPTIW